jgi:hypothetical protein
MRRQGTCPRSVRLVLMVAGLAVTTSFAAVASPADASAARSSGPATGVIYIADQVGCGFSVEGFGASWGFNPRLHGSPYDQRFGWTCTGSFAGQFLPAGPVVFTGLVCQFDGRGPFNPPLPSGTLSTSGTLIVYPNATIRAICPPATLS